MPEKRNTRAQSSTKVEARTNKSRSNEKANGGCFWKLVFFPFTIVNLVTNPFPGLVKFPLRVIGHLGMLGLIALTAASFYYYLKAQKYDMKLVANMPERTVILDKNQREIGRIHGEKRDVVPLSEVAPVFRQAVLAREDARFYEHGAIDIIGIIRAVKRNIVDRDMTQGASTITMQLARNSYKLGGRNIQRKMLEAAVAYRIEKTYTKDQILEHYVNRIFWGQTIRGVEEASKTYLEKSAKDLTLSDAAMLAGIIRGPNAFNPFVDVEKAKRERNTTLKRMIEKKMISQFEADNAMRSQINMRPKTRRGTDASYALDAVRRELDIILEEKNIELGGLTVVSTIDLLVQKKAEEALNTHLTNIEKTPGYAHQTRAQWGQAPPAQRGDPAYIQGSVVAVENNTGRVLAVVGGRDVNESQFNRAVQANRQIGSIFKPFVYLAAFVEGMKPSTTVSDDPIKPNEIDGSDKRWRPRNSDGKYRGNRPAAYGLIQSRNTMSVRVGDYAGLDNVLETARQAGFGEKVPKNPTSYLGSWESSTWKVASAFSIFSNNGTRYRPYLIEEIRDRNGNVVYETGQISYQAADSGPSSMVSNILKDVVDTGTASIVRKLGFNRDCAGKTGTTDDFHDAWFAGYTSHISCAVWIGFDTPKRTMKDGYGSRLAAPIWAEIMKTADRLGYKAEKLDGKLPTKIVKLCKTSGKRPTAECVRHQSVYSEAVPVESVPAENDFCPVHPVEAERVDEHSLQPDNLTFEDDVSEAEVVDENFVEDPEAVDDGAVQAEIVEEGEEEEIDEIRAERVYPVE